MGKISVDFYVAYKRNPGGSYAIHPTPRAVGLKGDRSVVMLGDVALPEGIPLPKNAITALYGNADSREELSDQMVRAEEQGMSFSKITATMEVGELLPTTIDLPALEIVEFANVKRVHRTVRQVLLDGVNELLVKEAGKRKAPTVFTTAEDLGRRPDLLCQVVRTEPMFKNLKAIAYMVPNGTPRGRQVCTLFVDSFADKSVFGETPFDVDLPKLA